MCISSNSVNQAQDLISVTKFEDFPNSLLPNAHAVSMQKFRNSSGNLAAATVSTSAILFKVVRGYCRGEPQNIARGRERGG